MKLYQLVTAMIYLPDKFLLRKGLNGVEVVVKNEKRPRPHNEECAVTPFGLRGRRRDDSRKTDLGWWATKCPGLIVPRHEEEIDFDQEPMQPPLGLFCSFFLRRASRA